MITNLTIKNYALIEDIKVNLGDGLTIITGETGAGKSILLGALSLLLGNRADLSAVKDPSRKCFIEAEFSIEDYNLQTFFAEEGLDYEKLTIIRREILPSGKSRAFINDTPVNLSSLSALGENLLDIHNQHQTLEVSSESFQFQVIDVLAETEIDLEKYKAGLGQYQKLKKEITRLEESKLEAQKELEYNTFLYQELKDANLKPEEQQELEEEFETFNNVEGIQEALAEASQLMDAEEIGALQVLKEIKLRIGRVKSISLQFQNLWDRLESLVIELDDISMEVNRHGERLELDPKRLLDVETKLQHIYKLQKKHQVSTIMELLELQAGLEEKIDHTTNLDTKIGQLEKELKTTSAQLDETGMAIHEKREKVLKGLITELEGILANLGLPNARFKIEVVKTDTFFLNGMNKLVFLFTANKGSAYGELKKVASGGELSRIMLAVKSVLAKHSKLPTIIFDEIDTGVSGEVANKIADILHSMSANMQVISITHLPQIAAKGKFHYKVYKTDIDDVTYTQLKLLEREERITELAQMLGGEKKSESAIAHAKELLN